MNNEKAIIIFSIFRKNGSLETHDIEVPLYITAIELVMGLNEAYHLGLDIENIRNCYLKAENPIALLRGNKLLSEYHVMNGTNIVFTEGER